MKYITIIVLFLLGSIIMIVGALFKLMHWPNSQLMLISASILQVIAVIILIIKLLTNKDKNSFLNK
ncbi:GldL-related protein [Flavobacterium rhizophilum]|uniref:GldL-related protein n=1 Tax=Flavobacterium rhizophilum TaxID=3163296 RepID=UPI0038B50C78